MTPVAHREGGGAGAYQQTIDVARQISAGPSKYMNQSKSKPHGTFLIKNTKGRTTNHRKTAVVVSEHIPPIATLQVWKQHSRQGRQGTDLRLAITELHA